jgi:hypothetical protein
MPVRLLSVRAIDSTSVEETFDAPKLTPAALSGISVAPQPSTRPRPAP